MSKLQLAQESIPADEGKYIADLTKMAIFVAWRLS